MAGSDGSGHWSIGEYYSKHIFPKTWGWIPVWSGGMPFPQYYPPFYFFFTALVAHLFPWVSYLTISKIVIVGSGLLIPVTVVWASKRMFNTQSSSFDSYIPALLSGVLSILIITTVGGQSSLGFTLEAALNKGFVPQFFALIPILLCLGFTAHIHTSKASRYGAGIFFLIALLTNVHTALLLVIVISIIACVHLIFTKKHRLQIIFTYVKVFGLAGFAASLWFFPLVATYDYFTTVPLPFDWDRIDLSLKIMFCISFPIAALIAIRRKNPVILGSAIGVSLIAIAAIAKMDQKFPHLPFHMYRWLAIAPYLSMIYIAYIADSISFKTLKGKIFFSIILLSFSAYVYKNEIRIYTDYGMYKNYTKENVDTLLALIQKNPGVTASGAEADLGRNASFIIDAKLGLMGIPTITHIIRESAPSGLFLTPTRNTFSAVFEMAGVRTYIGKMESFTRQPIEDRINRARGVGVRYIIATDPEVTGALSTSTQASFIAKVGPRHLYEIKNFEPKISVLENLPTLTFTNLNFKVRPPEEMSFTMLNEQALLRNAYPYIYFARDNDRNIDEIPLQELRNFGSLFLIEYTYKNVDRALDTLRQYATDRKIYVVKNKSTLYNKLKELSYTNKNIVIYEEDGKDERTEAERIVSQVFESIKNNPVKAEGVYPYYIRQTYFPWWKRTDGGSLYPISPFYTLTFFSEPKTDTDIESTLVFKTGKSVYTGGTVTVLVLCAILYFEFRRRS